MDTCILHVCSYSYNNLYCRGEEGGVQSKKELIMTARMIAKESEEVTKMARKVAAVCTDKRMKNVSVMYVHRYTINIVYVLYVCVYVCNAFMYTYMYVVVCMCV